MADNKLSWFSKQLCNPSIRLKYDIEHASAEFINQVDYILKDRNISFSDLINKINKSTINDSEIPVVGENTTIKTMAHIANILGYELHIDLHKRLAEDGPIYTGPNNHEQK